jgi:hypothetical protein
MINTRANNIPQRTSQGGVVPNNSCTSSLRISISLFKENEWMNKWLLLCINYFEGQRINKYFRFTHFDFD